MDQPTAAEPKKPAKMELSKETESSSEDLNHMATLAGLGLISHLAEWSELAAEQVVSERPGRQPLAVDPRDAVEPRKKFMPR